MQFKTLFLTFFAVSLIACSSTAELQQSKYIPIKQKAFSLSFPDQGKWAVVKNTPYKVVMTKLGLAYDDRYTLQVFVVKLPKFSSDEDFITFVTKSMKKSQKKTRIKVVEQQVQFIKKENKKCVRHNTKKKYSGRSKPVMLETASFICRHPESENAGVYLAYSKKYSLGNQDKYFNINATEIFNSMKLIAF